MAKIIYITGGAQSGKAHWAVNYFGLCDDVMYMCVYDTLEDDIKNRIMFNCEKNGINWNIQTGVSDVITLAKNQKFVILDNLAEYTNRVINSKCDNLGEIPREDRKAIEKYVVDEIIELIWEVKETNGTLLLISAEFGFCPIPTEPDQRVFRKIMSNINQRIANQASEVYLSVSGIHTKIK